MNNLAGAYQAAGKRDLALPLYEQTLKLKKARLGPDHPDTLLSMNNLAGAYWQAKQLDKSIPLFEEALKRQEAKLGRDHPDTLGTVGNLGVNYKDAGRLKEAMPLLEEAHRAAKKHPALRVFSATLLDAYAKAGENAKFAHLLQEQLAEAAKRFPRTARNWPACSLRSAWPSWCRKRGRSRTAAARMPCSSARRRSPRGG